jgi:hypothetical protein
METITSWFDGRPPLLLSMFFNMRIDSPYHSAASVSALEQLNLCAYPALANALIELYRRLFTLDLAYSPGSELNKEMTLSEPPADLTTQSKKNLSKILGFGGFSC